MPTKFHSADSISPDLRNTHLCLQCNRHTTGHTTSVLMMTVK